MRQEVTEQNNGLSRELQETAAMMTTHARRVYSKDFLLSVAELEECKRLPAGVDSVLLRETQSKPDDIGVAIPGVSSRGLIRSTRENDAHSESPPDVPEWRRPSSLPGSPFLKHGPRQTESNISSPRSGPIRGGNNPGRSIMGRSGSNRWEPRSSGAEGDRDMNRTQSEWESTPTESGGRLNGRGLARSALVVPQEHDGLLGSGGPIVQRGMMHAPTTDRHRAERTSRTGRTGEPYHSARGGKVSRNFQTSHYSRREDTDAVSDETFGSDDLPSGERSEHERLRRDRFEQMRIELRKKPLNTARNHNDWFTEGMQGTETFLSSSPGTPQSSSSKDDILKPHNKPVATSSTPRLLVPPGFSKPSLPKTGSPKENNDASKSLLYHAKDDDMHVLKQTSSTDGVTLDKQEHFSSLLRKIDQLEDKNQKTSSPLQSPVMSKFARWFPSQGSSIKESDSNNDNQKPMHLGTKNEDLPFLQTSSPATPELAGSIEDTVVSKLSSVASLLPVNNKGSVLPMPVGPSLEDVEKVMTAGADFAVVGRSGENRVSDKKSIVMLEDLLFSKSDRVIMGDAAQLTEVLHPERPSSNLSAEKKLPPVFLTCEDLEQSMLAETVHTGNHSKPNEVQHEMDQSINLIQLLQKGSNIKGGKVVTQQGRAVEQDEGKVTDGSASLHIMTLLQKNVGDAAKTSPLANLTNPVSAVASVYSSGHDHGVEDTRKKETQCNATEVVSLETLFFGKGFVNELRSVGEPVSSKLVVDDSNHIGKDSALFDVRRSGHGDVAYDRHHKEPRDSETTQVSDLQNDIWSDMLPHGDVQTKTSKIFPPAARGLSMNGSSLGDFRQPKSSPHLPHQGNFSHGQHHEGHHYPGSDAHSHRMPFESVQEPHFIHENALYGMGMYPPNSPFHPFHVPGLYEDRSSVVGGAYRMPSAFPAEYPESVQMGFNPSQGLSDPRIGGSRINAAADRWFTGDQIQASQGLAGFSPHQHPVPSMTQERKPGYVVSGLGVGPGVKNQNVGLPLDKRVYSETAQLPFVPGLDPYVLSGSRPDYG
eukprot:c39939_g1_i1 orf=872-4000(+)